MQGGRYPEVGSAQSAALPVRNAPPWPWTRPGGRQGGVQQHCDTFYRAFHRAVARHHQIGAGPRGQHILLGHRPDESLELLANLRLAPAPFRPVPDDPPLQTALGRQIDAHPGAARAQRIRPQGEEPFQNQYGPRFEPNTFFGTGMGGVIVDGPLNGVPAMISASWSVSNAQSMVSGASKLHFIRSSMGRCA